MSTHAHKGTSRDKTIQQDGWGIYFCMCEDEKMVLSRFSGSNSQKLERKITEKETKSQFFMLVWQTFFSLPSFVLIVKYKRKRIYGNLYLFGIIWLKMARELRKGNAKKTGINDDDV